MRIQSLTWDELKAVLKAAKETRERDWLMILVGFWHGLRASEVVGLKRGNVHDGFLTVQRLKGSKRTTQPLVVHEDPLLDERKALVDWCLKTPANQRLFPIGRKQLWTLFQQYAEQAGIPEHKRHPHCLKHTIGRQMIHSAGIENTRQYLGHESIASTGAYLEVSDDDACAAMRAAPLTASVPGALLSLPSDPPKALFFAVGPHLLSKHRPEPATTGYPGYPQAGFSLDAKPFPESILRTPAMSALDHGRNRTLSSRPSRRVPAR